MFKKIISVLLCFSLCFGILAVPASAVRPPLIDDKELSTDEMIKRILDYTGDLAEKQTEAAEAAAEAAESWAATATAIFGVVRNISTVIGLVNGVVSLLKLFGIIKDHSMDLQISILDGIYALQDTVEAIDKKVDRIQETLIDEFSSVDIKFAEQEYNHYKDEVWTNFYTDAVAPLTALQNEYTDEVNWIIVSMAEQWFDMKGSDVRSLYGFDAENSKIQIFSGLNFGDIGEALPREPRSSIEGIAVTDSITLPAEYISVNINPSETLSVDNCIEVLRTAFENGVYEAAENNVLVASDEFYANWEALSAKDKSAVSAQIADDLIDAVVFSASYSAANERRFASSVRSAYDNFCKWLSSSDSLTSPMYAQLKMLSLTHGFEGEITDEAETIYLYLDLMNINFGSFTETILSLSKAHTLKNCEDVKTNFAVSSYNLYNTYASFMTGNPNFCYTVNETIQYKDVSLESVMNVSLNDGVKSVKNWYLRDASVTYSEDEEKREEQIKEKSDALTANMLPSRDLKLLYLTYESQAKRGLTDCGSFIDYLIENKVIASCSVEKYPYGLSTQILTSYETESLNMTTGGLMNFCGSPTAVTPSDGEIYDLTYSYFVKETAFVKKGAIPKGWFGELDNIKYSDKATGSTISLLNGEIDENVYLAARVANFDTYSEGLSLYHLFAYCDSFSFNIKKLVDNRIVSVSDVTFGKNYGAIVTTDLSTYEFPADTKEIKSNFFGDAAATYKKIILNGIPETIAEDAFNGIGTEDNRCYLEVPEDAEIGDLVDKWHGGWFGDKTITLYKNDGSGESIASAQPKNMLCSDVKCPFKAPAGMEFAGWGITDSSETPDCNTMKVSERKGIFALWSANHEHKYITSDIAPTCTESGTQGRRVCTICGFVGSNGEVVPALGHNIQNEIGENICSRCGEKISIAEFGPFVVTGSHLDGVSVQKDSSNNYVLLFDGNGDFTVKNTELSTEVSASIVIAENAKVNLTLAGVNINGNGCHSAALEIRGGSDSDVVITLADGTENILKSYNGFAGLQKNTDAGTLTIEGNGILRATGGANAAGIGGTESKTSGRITINSGYIYADGGANGAGIGSGKNAAFHALTINGGYLTVHGGDNFPAIGSNMPKMSGTGYDTIYYINSGVITALAGKNCNDGIGAFYDGFFDNSNVKISPNASVYSSHTVNSAPYYYNGEEITPKVISNPDGKTIVIDGNIFPYKTHFDEKCVYVYLSDADHDINFTNSITTDKSVTNGDFTVSHKYAENGEIIELTAHPDEGYHLARWSVTPYTPVDGNYIMMPSYDITVSAVFEKNSRTVKWTANNVTTEKKYLYGDKIEVMEAEEKEGYRFTGWTPSVPEIMPDMNLEFTAVYSPVNYIAKFVADGKVIGTKSYTVENDTIAAPDIPQKQGYIASWEDYTVKAGGMTINAKYVPEIYMAKFVADGETVDEIPYTVETQSITPPVIPNKDGYTARWSDYTLTAGGITVNAIYTASVHEHTFASKYSCNEFMHWYPSTCGHDDIAKGLGEHTFGEGIKAGNATIYICTECSYVKIVSNELAELKAQAVAELESAAGTVRSAAMQSALDLAKTAVERAATAEEVTAAKESGLAVIRASEFAIGNCATSGKFIFGLEPLLTASSFSEKYIVNDNVSVDYTQSKQGVLGTGSTVNVTYFNGHTDNYSIVIFGDVNGDGKYDGTDAMIVSCIAGGMLSKEDVSEEVYMAADCNHDGTINQLDVELLQQAGVLLASVGQSKTQEELRTSSAYAEYLSLIDQTAETETVDTAETEEPEPVVNPFKPIIDFFKEIMAIIRAAIAFINAGFPGLPFGN